MRILGIDPGIAIVGFGLIEADRGRTRLLKTTCIRDKDVQTCYNRKGNTACLTVGKEDL